MLRLASSSSSSSSTVVRSALRAIASSRILSGPTANAIAASHQQLVTRKASHYFSTDAENYSTDRDLVKALKSEIKSHKLSLPPPESPDDFPFTINDGSKQKVVLTRELNGENIYVSIAKLEIIQEELSIIPADEEDGGTVRLPQPVILYVRIGKENRRFAVFGVAMCPQGMEVHKMSVMEPSPQSDDITKCYGLHDVEEEGGLQSAIQEYLKMRGIKPCYAEFMYRYMVWKSKHAALKPLKKIKKFIKDS